MEVVRCGECGATNPATSNVCWLCQRPFVAGPRPEAPVAEPAKPLAVTQRTFGLSSLMLLIALIAVCLGVMREVPGLGIALAVVATPALLRTIRTVARREARGRPMDVAEMIGAFFGSVAVVTTIGVAAGAVFTGTCFPVGLVAFTANNAALVILAFVLGFVAAGFVGYFLIRRLWPRKD